MKNSIIVNQEKKLRKKTSFLSSFINFLAIVSLLFLIFVLGKIHYYQSRLPNYEISEETFELLPDKYLPPEEPKEEERLKPLNDPREIMARLAAQKKWKNEVLPRLSEKKTIEEINTLLDTFYQKFKAGLEGHEKEWKKNTETKFIRPKIVNSRSTTEATLSSDIERCKKIFPELKQVGIFWEGFAGWLKEKEKGEESNDKVILGLCIIQGSGSNGKYIRTFNLWGNPKENLCYWTSRRITIKLKPELFFFSHNSWVIIEKNASQPKQIKIGWDQLLETIAHELAHAVINTILINDKVAKLEEGHGGLHDHFTKRIKNMIENSDEWNNFKKYVKNLDKQQN